MLLIIIPEREFQPESKLPISFRNGQSCFSAEHEPTHGLGEIRCFSLFGKHSCLMTL